MKARMNCTYTRLFIILLILPTLFVGCKQAVADGNDNDGSDQRAKEIYDHYCSNCHGKDLRGGMLRACLMGYGNLVMDPGM